MARKATVRHQNTAGCVLRFIDEENEDNQEANEVIKEENEATEEDFEADYEEREEKLRK